MEDAITYREIHERGFRRWNSEEHAVEQSLNALLTFGVKQPLPMVLAILREYKNKKIRLKHLKDTLKAIEYFHFLFTAVTSQRSSGGISFMYAKAARDLSDATDAQEKISILQDLKQKLQDRIPSYKEFEANFLEIYYSDKLTKRKPLVQYILSRLNEAHARGVKLNYGQMTIEHIAAQNPDGKKLLEESIAQIGNLILVDGNLNNKLANKSFGQKKPLLEDSHVWLDDVIRDANKWDDDEIYLRTLRLAEISYTKVWKL